MKKDHAEVMLEVINDQLKAIREGQEAMATVPGDIAALKNYVGELKDDMKVVKAVLTDQGKESRGIHAQQEAAFANHESRLRKLEHKAA